MRFLLLIAIAVTLAGCSAVDGLLRQAESSVVRFEVWNRTLDDVVLTDAAGQELNVLACDTALAVSFDVEVVRIHTDVGYVSGFGSKGVGSTGRQFLVLVAEPGESFPTPDRPVVLPVCEGHPDAQPGVFLP